MRSFLKTIIYDKLYQYINTYLNNHYVYRIIRYNLQKHLYKIAYSTDPNYIADKLKIYKQINKKDDIDYYQLLKQIVIDCNVGMNHEID